MEAFLKDNCAFVIISGQLFLSTAFLYVTLDKNFDRIDAIFDRMESSMETPFAYVKAEPTAIKAPPHRLEAEEIDLKEINRALIQLLERMERDRQVLQRLSHN